MRISRVVAALALLVPTALAGLVTAGPASADTQLTWCSGPTPTYPCISSASHDGTDISGDPSWDVSGVQTTVGDSEELLIDVMHNGSSDLGAGTLGDTFDITVKMDSLVPRVVTGKGRNASVTRSLSSGVYTVDVVGDAVSVQGQCDQSTPTWTCPEYTGAAPDTDRTWDAAFGFDITDYGSWEDTAQRESMYGMNYFTNVAATSSPPEIDFDRAGNPVLLVRMANRHFEKDGTTVVHGRGEIRIPNSFLKEVYGIPDPSTMTSGSLDPTLSGSGAGTIAVTPDPSGGAMLVTVDGVTFTQRNLRVRTGTIVPTKPTQVSATRTAARRGFVDFEPSKARGARPTGYAGKCVQVGGNHTVTSTSDNIVRFTGLRSGKAYDCKVRAKSQAGNGPWSSTVRMSRTPSNGR